MSYPERRGVNRRGKRPKAGAGDVLTKGAHQGASPLDTPCIRTAGRDDLEALLALEAAFPGDRLSRRAMRHHLASPKAVCLVAETDGRLLGYALLLHRSGSSWWRVYSLIRAGGAPRGTGRRLLEAALEAARLASAQGVRLEVREDNTSAIRLYRRLGFTLFATADGYYEDGARACRMKLAFGD